MGARAEDDQRVPGRPVAGAVRWRGATPEEAFYVSVGRETMSQDDIDNGHLICVIGVAPVKPAEFVIFRITQKTSEAVE